MTEEKKSDVGEFKKRIHKRMERSPLASVDDILEDAKKELLSTVHENCWWSTEVGCHAPNWFIYHKQPEDCPKRRLEKWLGT